MSRATPQLRDLARRLIAAEASVVNAAAKTPSGFLVCERLRSHLSNLMGRDGFHALLSRSLVLASKKVDWLYAVALTGNGLGVSEKVEQAAGPEAMAEGELALVSEMLALLVTFIGEGLVLKIVHEIWPNLPLKDVDSGDNS